MSPDWIRILFIAISGILNAVGFFGLFLVFFPGLTVSWVGHLIWVILRRFQPRAFSDAIWAYHHVFCDQHFVDGGWIAHR